VNPFAIPERDVRIFISYRRDDSLTATGRIDDHLRREFGQDAVFRDIDSIPLGIDFVAHIERAVSDANVVLAIIGPRWATSQLGNENDLVRREIEAALELRRPIIPVLVEAASLPTPDKVPPSLHSLLRHNGLRIDSGGDFPTHFRRLVDGIKRLHAEFAEHGRQPGGEPVTVRESTSPIRLLSAATGLAAAKKVGDRPREMSVERVREAKPALLNQAMFAAFGTAIRARKRVVLVLSALGALAILWLRVASGHPDGTQSVPHHELDRKKDLAMPASSSGETSSARARSPVNSKDAQTNGAAGNEGPEHTESSLLPDTDVTQTTSRIGPSKVKRTQTVVTTNGGVELVRVPSGTFMMGSPNNEDGRFADEAPVHRVTISSFLIGKYEVTREQYDRFLKANPDVGRPVTWSDLDPPDIPVVHISWSDANRFAKWDGARLPTEAEWEYATRAGTTGSTYGRSEKVAWYFLNAYGSRQPLRAHRVGELKPNGFGLFDTLGNVWEWCNDWHGPYTAAAAHDPSGPISGSMRVIRGGSWQDKARHTRAANRKSDFPDNRTSYTGFRIAREP
jgi:formylglycine-generating enzyme required for sulfatase activity